MLFGSLILVAGISVDAAAYLQHPKFGKLPEGGRLERVEQSPHVKDGEFRNLVATALFEDDSSFASVLVGNLLSRPERLQPGSTLPAVKTDLKALDGGDALDAKALLPAHVGKFSIVRHRWDEPFERIAAAGEGKRCRLLTPMIGNPIYLADERQRFVRWWRSGDADVALVPGKPAEWEIRHAYIHSNRRPGAGSVVVRMG